MNDRAFQKFLATGEYVPTMDSAENPGAEFKEKWKAVPQNATIRPDIKRIIEECQLQPDEHLRQDSLSLMNLFSTDGHFIVELSGGTNGSPDERKILAYLAVVRKFCKKMLDENVAERIWLIDWKNDCADDVWYARLAFKTKPDPKEKENAPEQ